MAKATQRSIEPLSRASEPEPIDTTSWPPMPDEVRAAWVRMAREPHLLDDYGDDDWVAFSGDEIVSSGPVLEEVIRAAEEAGKPVTLIVPIMGSWI
jgi:hypothetical protein